MRLLSLLLFFSLSLSTEFLWMTWCLCHFSSRSRWLAPQAVVPHSSPSLGLSFSCLLESVASPVWFPSFAFYVHALPLPPAGAFFSILSHCAPPSHAPPLVNRYGQKSHCTSAVRKNIFQSACLHAAHIAMQLEIWRALQGWNKLKSDTETWLVIFRALDSAGGVHWKIYHLFLFDFNTQFYSLLSFFVSSLICLLSHASPWPYTIFQRGFDLVMGEQPSDRIFR